MSLVILIVPVASSSSDFSLRQTIAQHHEGHLRSATCALRSFSLCSGQCHRRARCGTLCERELVPECQPSCEQVGALQLVLPIAGGCSGTRVDMDPAVPDSDIPNAQALNTEYVFEWPNGGSLQQAVATNAGQTSTNSFCVTVVDSLFPQVRYFTIPKHWTVVKKATKCSRHALHHTSHPSLKQSRCHRVKSNIHSPLGLNQRLRRRQRKQPRRLHREQLRLCTSKAMCRRHP